MLMMHSLSTIHLPTGSISPEDIDALLPCIRSDHTRNLAPLLSNPPPSASVEQVTIESE